MTQLTVKIKNIKQVEEAFKKIPVKMGKELDTAINKIILKIENTAKKEAPVNKQSGGGNLRQSIISAMTGFAKGIVQVNADYGVYVHEGTRPHVIKILKKKVLANKRSGQFFGVKVNHPGTKANPFLQRAIDKNQSYIDQQFENAVINALK